MPRRMVVLFSGLLGCAACASAPVDAGSADRSLVDVGAADHPRLDEGPADGARFDQPGDRGQLPALDLASSEAGLVDADGDGIPDAEELVLAARYFPYLSLAPADACPRHGVLFRLTPHPVDASKLALRYVVLYEKDCGALGHPGDNEAFGALVDPQLPPPKGLLALRAVSHQGTLCERTTSCGSLAGCDPCATAARGGIEVPVVFASLNKHGGYVAKSTCDLNLLCDLGGCTLNPQPSAAPLVNAGEPGAPLVTDLTAQGFITAQHGWTDAALAHYDPWGGATFGEAGKVSEDLVDPAFLLDPNGCN